MVERSVPYVRDALVGGYELKNIEIANETALRWCRGEAGERDHGTTRLRPYQAFCDHEAKRLKELPMDRFEIAHWKEAKVHRNHHLTFDNGYYSVPTRYVGEMLWVRGTADSVKIFDKAGTLIWTWEPARPECRWRTEPNHYPPGKRAFLIQSPSYCREKARQLGLSVERLIEEVLKSSTNARLRKAQAILRLGERFGAERLERACERAFAYDALEYSTIKNILIKGLESETTAQAPQEAAATNQEELAFLRSPDSFVHESQTVAGGVS